MKEKRFLCDYKIGKFLGTLRGICIFFVLTFCTVFMLIKFYFNEEIYTYSESNVQYLEEVSKILIDEGKEIKLTNIPKDIYTNTEVRDNLIYFSCSKKKEYKFTPETKISLILSNDLEIISKEYSYNSEIEYRENTEDNINSYSVSIAFILALGLSIGLYQAVFYSELSKNQWRREHYSIFALRKIEKDPLLEEKLSTDED